MDVGIDRKCRFAERLRHDDTRCFVPDTRQGLQIGKVCRHLTVVAVQQLLSKPNHVL